MSQKPRWQRQKGRQLLHLHEDSFSATLELIRGERGGWDWSVEVRRQGASAVLREQSYARNLKWARVTALTYAYAFGQGERPTCLGDALKDVPADVFDDREMLIAFDLLMYSEPEQ